MQATDEREEPVMSTTRWENLTAGQKAAAITGVSIQLSLAASAWADLACRPKDQVNGRKDVWAAVIAINFLGPILYFWKGVRRGPKRSS